MGVTGAIIGAGALTAGATVIGSNNSANAAKSAADTQAQAAEDQIKATQQQEQMIAQNEAPFLAGGTNAFNLLTDATETNVDNSNPLFSPLLQAPAAWDPSQVASTPGYQFSLQQGEQATQNSFAANGLGASGAAQKGATNYAEGLAGTTYQNDFANYLSTSQLGLSSQQQQYNMLAGLAGTGQNAAAQEGGFALNAQTQANQLATSAAAAQAAGTIGAANATNAGISGVASSIGNAGVLGSLLGGQSSTADPLASGGAPKESDWIDTGISS